MKRPKMRAKFSVTTTVELSDMNSCKGCIFLKCYGGNRYHCFDGYYINQAGTARPKRCKTRDCLRMLGALGLCIRKG